MKITSVLLFATVFLIANAHLASKGFFLPTTRTSSKVYRLPPLDNNLLISEEDGSHGGYQFGKTLDFFLNSNEDGEWTFQNGANVWTCTIRSGSAKSIGLTFKGLKIPFGGELYLVGESKILGAYTFNNTALNTQFFTTFPLEGSYVTIQYFQPIELNYLPELNIVKATHGYRSILGFGSSGKCNINVACDDGEWSNQIRSSGMLLSGFGSRFCSGALINNIARDKTQYFLTANHCSVDSQDLIMFNYQSPQCSPNTDGNTDSVIGGIVRLASNVYSDFTIVEITEPIPKAWNVYLSGFSAENIAPKSMVGIHHPSGDVKKISYANKAGIPDRWNTAEPGLWHWRVSSWDDGTTEPGSSGSPLYDQNKRIIGQLHGGAASCANKAYDSYGAVWASWANGLSKYLDPQATGSKSVDGENLA